MSQSAQAEDALRAVLAQRISDLRVADADNLAHLLVVAKAIMNEDEVEEGLGKFTVEDFISFGLVNARARILYNSLHPPGAAGHPPPAPPEGLPTLQFRVPHRLCSSTGSGWTYQGAEQHQAILRDALTTHYDSWCQRITDKTLHPLIFVASAPGTGKSRLLDEFQGVVHECLGGEIKAKINNAYVFKISFENGTSGDDFEDPGHKLGTRMLYQLMNDGTLQWDNFRRNYRASPVEVMERLAADLGQSLKDMTILLLVDTMQVLQHEPGSKHSEFYKCLDEVKNQVNAGTPFVIAVCAATIELPVSDFLGTSPQLHLHLSPCLLDGSKIIESDDPITKILVQDMGGHGRALETLQDVLSQQDEDFSLAALMHNVRRALEAKYSLFLKSAAQDFKHVLRVILARIPLQRDSKIPQTTWTVDELVSFGLFSFQGQYVECPFVLLWLLAPYSHDSILTDFRLGEYHEIDANQTTERELPRGVQCWQNFEELSALFQCLRARVFAGQVVSVGQLHAGARWKETSPCPSIQVDVKVLEFTQASEQVQTKSSLNVDVVPCEYGEVHISDCRNFILNGSSAPAGDAFVDRCVTNAHSLREVHAYKHIQSTVDNDLYREEWLKAASKDDLFLLFTTHAATVELPDDRCAIVDQTNFTKYFGLFVDRAYMSAHPPSNPRINSCKRKHLESVPGIGVKRAKTILKERASTTFTSAQHASSVLHISERILDRFDFS
eukprot:TRINITY_DN225_c0_g1_i7.p1 TRINITY_DN225_c0_g1~~TRINITY_DN225_c0_g1_i7.p1  ORF type:complete len:725 (-),score=86.60 TRINITY_DN225_c0_g1_i7:127-2301(-)